MASLKEEVASKAKSLSVAIPLIWPLPIVLAIMLASDRYREFATILLWISGFGFSAVVFLWIIRVINRRDDPNHTDRPPDAP
jgi:hypothetical protein